MNGRGVEPPDDLLAAALDAAPSGIVLWDPELRIVAVNRAAERISRIRRAHLGVRLADAFPEASPEVVEAFERAFKTGDGSHDLEVPDGESGRRFTIDVFPVRARGGSVELVGCMFADVSDRVARGRLSRELSAIVTSSDDAIMSKGLDGMIRSWNAAAERLYGYTAAEAIGRSIALIVPDQHSGEIGEILREIAADRRVEHYETVRRRKDGALVNVSLSISPMHDAEGRVVAASVIALDVGARLAMEDALQESERRRLEILASMLRAEEVERSRIATELHDDTVQVMTASLFALDRVALVARRAENHQIESAVMLTRATLEEATARARRLMFELRPAILHEQGLVAAVSVLADQTRRETGAQTVVSGTPRRYGYDVEELAYRSIQEALVNVRKHSEANEVAITLEDEGSALLCEVADDGRGFDPVAIRDRPGAALHAGIDSMVERVRAAGGETAVESAPGAGTRVRLWIPVDRSGTTA
jgi:PAS domain S-box-containing protein